MRLLTALVFLLAAVRLDAAMVLVVTVEDARTLVIDRNGARETVRLAGVEITDDAKAREFLRWTAVGTWVMVEAAGNGESRVYRSPDALFLNRELVVRGYARPTAAGIAPDLRAPARYLGEIQPVGAPRSKPAVSAKAAPKTRSGTGSRSTKSRTRRGRGAPPT
jgi:hypothetical protein